MADLIDVKPLDFGAAIGMILAHRVFKFGFDEWVVVGKT